MNVVEQKYMGVEKERKFIVLLSLAWAVAVVAGMVYLVQYRDTPGMSAPLSDWPAQSTLKFDPRRDTLIMVVHPRCPCSKASMAELSRLMAKAQDDLAAYVIFVRPEGFPDDWEKSDLWAAAEAIPGVHVLVDDKGVEAEHFQAATSGQSMLYDKNGKLLFSGGITSGRGHEGDNDGRSAIISLLNAGQAEKNATPVYGCPLFAPNKEVARTEDKNAPHKR